MLILAGAATAALRLSRQLVSDLRYGLDPCAGCDPLVIGLKFEAELVVKDPQVTVLAARDRLRHNRLHLLSDNSDIGCLATVINEAIEAEAVVEMSKKGDVVLKPEIGPPWASAASAADAATARASPASAAGAAVTVTCASDARPANARTAVTVTCAPNP